MRKLFTLFKWILTPVAILLMYGVFSVFIGQQLILVDEWGERVYAEDHIDGNGIARDRSQWEYITLERGTDMLRYPLFIAFGVALGSIPSYWRDFQKKTLVSILATIVHVGLAIGILILSYYLFHVW